MYLDALYFEKSSLIGENIESVKEKYAGQIDSKGISQIFRESEKLEKSIEQLSKKERNKFEENFQMRNGETQVNISTRTEFNIINVHVYIRGIPDTLLEAEGLVRSIVDELQQNGGSQIEVNHYNKSNEVTVRAMAGVI